MATQALLEECGFASKKTRATKGGKMMKKTMSMFAALAMMTGLCVGCGNEDKPKPEAPKQPKKSSTTNWAPEMTKQPKEDNATNDAPETEKQSKAHKADDGQDHSGHGH